MARTIQLPSREGSIQYTADEIAEVREALDGLPKGQAVVVDDAQETETKARTRSRVMQERLAEGTDPVKVKSHAVEDEDGNWIPAVSLPVGKPKAQD